MRQKENPNLLFLWYEDMVLKREEVLRQMCDFLEMPLSNEKISQLAVNIFGR